MSEQPKPTTVLVDEKPSEKATDNLSDIDRLISGYTEEATINETPTEGSPSIELTPPVKKRRGRRKKKAIVEGEILTGAMFLFLVDTIFPTVICAVHNQFSRRKVKPDKLMLTDKQKKELEPLAGQVAEQLQAKGDPVSLFILTMISLYGVNLMMASSETQRISYE